MFEQDLWKLTETMTATIKGFSEQIPSEHLTRLRELGIDIDKTITCLKKTPFKGPKVYQISDGVFSLDEETAIKIEVMYHN